MMMSSRLQGTVSGRLRLKVVLSTRPQEAAVVGSPDIIRGFVVCVRRSGSRYEPSDNWHGRFRNMSSLPGPYKYPRKVEFVKEPKTISGKIKERIFREMR